LNVSKLGGAKGIRNFPPPALRIFVRKAYGKLLQPGTPEERLRRYCTRLPDFVPSPVFVKVGANDGVTGDPVSDIFLADARWKGLLIEPVPFCFQRLAANFRDSNRFSLEQVAIGQSTGVASFYYVDRKAAQIIPDLPDWFDQLGSFEKNHIIKHLNGALEPFIVEEAVPVLTLPDVLEKHGIREVHLLHIDTEGFDYAVLKTLDLTRRAFKAILIEHKHLSGDQHVKMLNHLRENGYRVDNCGGDYFAVQRKTPLQTLVWDVALPLASR
jgi:FkbM family methyltransferase